MSVSSSYSSDVRCMFRMCHSRQCVVVVCCPAFELQDTIHALIKDKIHFHDQLEILTRELRQLLLQHSSAHTHEHDEELHHHWEEWSQHSITPETHLLLEHALCGNHLHGSAHSTSGHVSFVLITFLVLAHILL